MAIDFIKSERPLQCEAKRYLVRTQLRYESCFILTEGLLLRERDLGRGRRQIVGLHLPGDVCNLAALSDGCPDYDMLALSHVSCIPVRRHWLSSVAQESVDILHAVWREMSRETAIAAAWIVNLGQRPAYQRIAYFLCELEARLRAAGHGVGSNFDWRGSQSDIGAVTGLSPVHVNRTLRKLVDDNLVTYGRRLQFHDVPRLQSTAGFDPSYLELDRERLGDLLLSRLGLADRPPNERSLVSPGSTGSQREGRTAEEDNVSAGVQPPMADRRGWADLQRPSE